MYTSYIGKKFLKLYNKQHKTRHSARKFFDTVFFRLFFTDDIHLLHVTNSPFFQKPKEEDVKLYGSVCLAQLANLRKNICNDVPNMSIMVGAAAKDIGSTTSGQVSDIPVTIDEEEIYASWIGAALGIGVNGGCVILIDNEMVLLALYDGWKYYRKFLDQSPKVKDKQIETWNGQWICHYFSSAFRKTRPLAGLNIKATVVQGKLAIPTQLWSRIVFALSKKLPNHVITMYAYMLSQTNTTIGFINIYLKEIHEMYELRDHIFIAKRESISDHQIEQLEPFYTFKNACRLGTIGLKSIEPNHLREYMPIGSAPYATGKEFNFNNKSLHHIYNIYKIWICAMLNKTTLLELATEVAASLVYIESKDDRGRKILTTLSKDVRESKNIKEFIQHLTDVLQESTKHATAFRSCVEQILKMPTDNFPLFITLIRFEYAYQKIKH